MRSTLLPRPPRVLVAGLVLACSISAFAQSADPNAEKARKLFDEATAELDSGKYATACPKLEEVTRLAPEGIGAKETLAECYEKQGRLASAWKQYTAAEALARKQGKLDRAKEAQKAAAALKPRLSVITVLPPAVPGLVLQLDGAAVEAKTAIPADGGAHTLVASAPGYKPFSSTVAVPAEKARVDIQVPPLETEESTPPPPPPPPTADSAGPADRPASGINPRFVAGIAAAGLGVASVAAGIASSLQVSEAQSVLDEHRGDLAEGQQLCTNEGQSGLAAADRDRVKIACDKATFVPLQFVFYGLGAALAGTSAYLLVTSRREAPTASARQPAPPARRAAAAPEIRIQPAAGPSGAWLSVAGRF